LSFRKSRLSPQAFWRDSARFESMPIVTKISSPWTTLPATIPAAGER
jgi:hypothetical protein